MGLLDRPEAKKGLGRKGQGTRYGQDRPHRTGAEGSVRFAEGPRGAFQGSSTLPTLEAILAAPEGRFKVCRAPKANINLQGGEIGLDIYGTANVNRLPPPQSLPLENPRIIFWSSSSAFPSLFDGFAHP
jgi:hypothetical protein